MSMLRVGSRRGRTAIKTGDVGCWRAVERGQQPAVGVVKKRRREKEVWEREGDVWVGACSLGVAHLFCTIP